MATSQELLELYRNLEKERRAQAELKEKNKLLKSQLKEYANGHTSQKSLQDAQRKVEVRISLETLKKKIASVVVSVPTPKYQEPATQEDILKEAERKWKARKAGRKDERKKTTQIQTRIKEIELRLNVNARPVPEQPSKENKDWEVDPSTSRDPVKYQPQKVEGGKVISKNDILSLVGSPKTSKNSKEIAELKQKRAQQPTEYPQFITVDNLMEYVSRFDRVAPERDHNHRTPQKQTDHSKLEKLQTSSFNPDSNNDKPSLPGGATVAPKTKQSELGLPLPPVIVEATNEQTAAVVWIHGLGENGQTWRDRLDRLMPQLPHAKFIFPTAPLRNVKLINKTTNAWYNLGPDPNHITYTRDEEKELELACLQVILLINQQLTKGIEPERIVLAGFSQGATVAFRTTFVLINQRLGGIATICAKPLFTVVPETIGSNKKSVPYLCIAGEKDPFVSLKDVQDDFSVLESLGFNKMSNKTYPGTKHVLTDEGLDQVFRWISRLLPVHFTPKEDTSIKWL